MSVNIKKILPWNHLKADLPASLVVFLVALPLCLGIALASGAPLLAGLISGIIGGIVVGMLSKSSLSVSGPAAGLTLIVSEGIAALGTYSSFLTAVVLAGGIQIALGLIRAGGIVRFVPVCVIHGMLAAIGCILILKQLPHAVGYDADYEGDESFAVGEDRNTFSEIINAVVNINPGALTIFMIALASLILWQMYGRSIAKSWLPPALIAVTTGTLVNLFFERFAPSLYVSEPNHMVTIPEFSHTNDIFTALVFPNWSDLLSSKVWILALTIAAIASVETLLSVDATDKLDPHRRITPTNRELKAQGVGNIVAGLIGGLPMTAVIVRSSANVSAGAQTRTSAVVHGILLLFSVVVFASLLNLIPLAALAAVLMVMGFKLITPKLIREHYKRGFRQFIPFIVTILAILLSDLLIGVLIGIAVGIFFVILSNFNSAIIVTQDGSNVLIRFAKDVSFINKPSLMSAFERIPDGAKVLIDGTRAQFIDHDIMEAIKDFLTSAQARKIHAELRRSPASLNLYFKEQHHASSN